MHKQLLQQRYLILIIKLNKRKKYIRQEPCYLTIIPIKQAPCLAYNFMSCQDSPIHKNITITNLAQPS